MGRNILAYLVVAAFFISSTSAECPVGWANITNNCYGVIGNSQLTWNESLTFCAEQGTQLAKVEDANDFRQVYLYILGFELEGDFWLGASDWNVEGDFMWLDGSRVPRGTPYWAVTSGILNQSQEPTGGADENCLAMNSDRYYYYDDMDCYSPKNFICMIPSSSAKLQL